MSRLLILVGGLALGAVAVGWHAPADSRLPAVVSHTPADLDVEAELRIGCAHLIDLACGGTSDAAWAVRELQRAAAAPWATPALKAQAQAGLAQVAASRSPLVARR